MYDMGEFEDEIDAHFEIERIETMIYKPFANSQMNTLPKYLIDECMEMEMFDGGAEIFVVCSQHGVRK